MLNIDMLPDVAVGYMRSVLTAAYGPNGDVTVKYAVNADGRVTFFFSSASKHMATTMDTNIDMVPSSKVLKFIADCKK